MRLYGLTDLFASFGVSTAINYPSGGCFLKSFATFLFLFDRHRHGTLKEITFFNYLGEKKRVQENVLGFSFTAVVGGEELRYRVDQYLTDFDLWSEKNTDMTGASSK